MYMLFYYNIWEIKYFSMSFTLSSVETNLAIVCACAPTLRGLLRSWFPRALAAEEFVNADDDPYVEAKSPSSAGVRPNNRTSFGECMFGYPKEARARAHVEVEGLGLTPSEEDMIRENRAIAVRTDVVESDNRSSRGGEDEGIGRRVSGDSIWVRSRFPRG